jgi:hypothetical protein
MQSPGWARLLLHSIIAEAHSRWPAIGPQQHIDDLSQTCVAAREVALKMENVIVESALFIRKELGKKGISLASKSVIIPRRSPRVRRIAMRLRVAKMHIATANSGRDLGIDACAGSGRSTKVAESRFRKSRARVKRIGQFSQTNRKAKKLFATGAKPQAIWGFQAYGCSSAKIDTIRKMAMEALGYKGGGHCTTTMLALELGSRKDPAVEMRVLQLQEWYRVWISLSLDDKTRTKKLG